MSAKLTPTTQMGKTYRDYTDPFMRHNTLNFFLGYGLNLIFLYGTHQPQVQRYCSLPTYKQAVKSILLSMILNILIMSLMLATGIAIFATYAGCDPVLLGDIKRSDQIVPHFVINELANIPGMLGLLVARVFSAVLSSLSSILNSLSAVTWQDFLSRMPYFQRMTDAGQANTSKLLVVFYGIITILFGFGAQYMGPIFQATLKSFGAINGPLGAVFLVGLFMPCVNKWGAMCGLLGGLSAMLYIGISSLGLSEPYNIPLPTNVDDCPAGTNLTMALLHTPKVLGEFEWPEKLFTLSYIMYPFVGACLTVFMSLLISGLTGGFCSANKVKRKYLHPLLRGRFGAPEEEVPHVTTDIRIRFLGHGMKGARDSVKDTNSSGKKSPLPYKNYNYKSVPTKTKEKV